MTTSVDGRLSSAAGSIRTARGRPRSAGQRRSILRYGPPCGKPARTTGCRLRRKAATSRLSGPAAKSRSTSSARKNTCTWLMCGTSINGIDAQVAHPRAGFLGGLANGRLLDGFAVLHEAGRQGPVTEPWLDGASAQQHFRAPGRHAAGDDIGVLVVNGLTAVADKTQARIAFGNALDDRVAALTAKFHAWVPECCAYLGVRRCQSASCRLATRGRSGVGRSV